MTCYFDRVFVSDNILLGFPSRFIPTMRAAVPLNGITKTEVQDGGKNYNYTSKWFFSKSWK